jgi:predicted molibdopterin-dependent oxidoreductase YjgC
VVTIRGAEKFEMIQKGSLILQKIPGVNTIVSQQSNEKTDLFKKYFGYMVEGQVDDRLVQKIDAVNDGYTIYTRFRVKAPVAGETKIDYIDYYFNGDSLLTQTVIYAESKELVKSAMQYIEKDGIFVVAEFRTEMWSEGSKIVSIIKYDTINVNTAVADREFELK